MPEEKPKRSLLGLVSRKERWALTWRGRLVLVLIAGIAAIFVVRFIHPFLAVTKSVSSPVLVVEGWISMTALRAAAEQFQSDGYQILYTTGGPTGMNPDSTNVSDTYASVTAKKLLALGVPKDFVQMVPCGNPKRDRTYTSAVALRDLLKSKQPTITSLNVLTEGVHARRTRLMYEAAFGDGFQIGVIAIKDRDYDPEQWWRYSEGVKEVISEAGAYLYAKLLFRADD